MEKVVIELTRENVEDYLRSSFLKPTPEVVTAILQAIDKAVQDGDSFGIIEDVLWEGRIPLMLESL